MIVSLRKVRSYLYKIPPTWPHKHKLNMAKHKYANEEEESREPPIKLPKVSHRILLICIAY